MAYQLRRNKVEPVKKDKYKEGFNHGLALGLILSFIVGAVLAFAIYTWLLYRIVNN